MKNINKNAVQALWLNGKAYLAHKAIDGFTLGQGDFTIEVAFICNEVNNCLFYAQEQGFAFGIRDKHLYFELEGVGSITQEKISVETDTIFSAAVSCREGKLALYFEGLPVTDAIDVNLEVSENNGDYVIGKGLNGYIVDLRLRSCGMEDQEILLDNGAGLKECDSIEFWGDFTTAQYMDKSPNALYLWTEQGIVKCMNVTSCTKLSLRGGFVAAASNSFDSGYTLLFKVYPQIENVQKMYVYSAVSEHHNAVFSVGIEPDDKGDSHAFVEYNGNTCYCETTLPLAEWVDIALRIEGTDAALFVDGVKQLTFTFEGELSNITSIIGIKPFQNKISYTNSFWGYLDYFAEFECALDEEKIAFYAEEQPYIFDESIRTLYAFFCGEPIELVSGSAVLLAGKSKSVFEKNLNSMSAPIGMDLRVPQEVCAEWQELSEYEQWATTAAMDMVRETYSQSMGLAMPEGMIPIEQTATKQIRQLFEEEIHEVKTVWTPENQDNKSNKFIGDALIGATGGVGTAVAGVVVFGGTAAGGATATKFAAKGVLSAAVVAAAAMIGGSFIPLQRKLLEDEAAAKKKMPVNDEVGIEIISLLFNHRGNPKVGSIHFHSDKKLEEPKEMIYSLPANKDNMDMLLILDELGKNLKVILKIENKSNEVFDGKLCMKADRRFSENSVTVKLPAKSIKEFELELPMRSRKIIGLSEQEVVNFQFCVEHILLCQYDVGVFLQNKVPIKPWNIHCDEEYSKDIKEYPSLCFLRNLVSKEETGKIRLGERKEEFNAILNEIYSNAILNYDSAALFTNRYNQFNLRDFLISIVNTNIETEVNCTDCANIVSLIAAVLGIKMNMNLIFGYRGFSCNPIMLIPSDTWSKNVEFSYHQVAFYTDEKEFNRNAEIYDLSLKIDAKEYPSIMPEQGTKNPFLSGGYKAYELDDYIIEIQEPYAGQYYLERLIKKGQAASFTAKQVSTEFWTDNKQQASNDLYTELMQQYIHSYRLDDEKYAVEISQSEVQQSLLPEIGLEAKLENLYICKWSAPDDRKLTWFRNAEHLPAGEYLASVLMRYSCRLTEKEAPELGERVFYGPNFLITYFEGSAYSINCKDIEKAEELAHSLKSSMIR